MRKTLAAIIMMCPLLASAAWGQTQPYGLTMRLQLRDGKLTVIGHADVPDDTKAAVQVMTGSGYLTVAAIVSIKDGAFSTPPQPCTSQRPDAIQTGQFAVACAPGVYMVRFKPQMELGALGSVTKAFDVK